MKELKMLQLNKSSDNPASRSFSPVKLFEKIRGGRRLRSAGKGFLLIVLLVGFVFLTAGCDAVNFTDIESQSNPGGSSGETFTVSGTIVDEDDNPIENARITTLEADETTTSDSRGNWEINSLEGEVTIKAAVEGDEDEDFGFEPSEVIADSDRSDIKFTARKLDFDDGDGSEADPYLITRADQLYDIRFRLDGHYTLGDDIDLSEYENWDPIGRFVELDHEDNVYFRGSFDGNGHQISGLRIDRPEEKGVGLFAALGSGAEVENLTLAVDSISGHEWVGALSGRNLEAEIFRIGVVAAEGSDGEIAGSGLNIGGLIGANRRGIVEECFAEVDVVLTGGSDSTHAGGLAGYNNYEITNSYARGDIIFEGDSNSQPPVGALIGLVHDEDSDYLASISSSYATGKVIGWDGEDSLIGEINNDFIEAEDSYYGEDAESIDEDTPGWDSSIWDFTAEDYPVLKW